MAQQRTRPEIDFPGGEPPAELTVTDEIVATYAANELARREASS